MRFKLPTQGNQVRVIVWALLLTLIPFGIATAPTAAAATIVTLSDTDALTFDKAKTTNIKGTGTTAGDVVLYRNVGVFGGVSIDAVVTTVSISAGSSISNYDNPGSASTAAGYLNNFQLNTVGGSVQMQFDFYVSGSYTVAGSGSPVILQNVKITSIDLDTSGTTAYQYSDFTGFQTYSMTADTNLLVQPLSSGAGARFIAGKSGARSSVPQDQVLIKYTTVTTLKVTFGNVTSGSTNYFGLMFGAWPGTGTPIEYPNVFNTPPTSSNTTLYVPATDTTTLTKANFGNFSDVDNNPFVSIKVASPLPAAGTLKLNGVNVTANQIISIADIDLGKLTYTTSNLATSPAMTFYVYDGQDFSTGTYTLTFSASTNSQTIKFVSPGTQKPGALLASGATATSGLTVTLTSNTPGICSVSGLDITTLANGTCQITATQAGNSTYGAALPVVVTFPVASGSAQTITFGNPGSKTVGTTFTAAPTATSGLPVLLVSMTPSVCTVSGNVITFLAAGTCTITASQAGDLNYSPATNVTQSFTVSAPATTSLPIAARTAGVAFDTSQETKYASLYGYLDMNGNSNGLTYQFCYSKNSTSNSSGALTSSVSCVSKDSKTNGATSTLSSGTANDQLVTSLKLEYGSKKTLSSGTTYYYQVVAYPTGNSSGKVYGKILKFKTSSPYAWTKDASSVDSTTAKLNGVVNSSSTTTQVSYCWTTSFNTQSSAGNMLCEGTGIIASSIRSANSDTSTPMTISGLTPNTTYYFQIIAAQTSSGVTTTYYANILKFKTLPINPSAVTTQPTSVAGTTATLNGSILAQGTSTGGEFCWGTSSSLSSCTTVAGTPSSSSSNGATLISANLTGLTSGTTYYYKAVATRGSGSSKVSYSGAIVSFKPGAPSATTLAASDVASGWTAKLNGFVNTYTLSTNVTFCYGTSSATNAGALTTCTSVSADTTPTSSNAAATKTLTGLSADTTYYFQVIGTNASTSSLVSYGNVMSFVTSAAPGVTTVAADSVTATTARIKGTLTANGAATYGSFCVSTASTLDPDSGVLQNCSIAPYRVTLTAGNASGLAYNYSLINLTPGTTYYFQASGENTRGTIYGSVENFTTASLPVAVTSAASSVTSTQAVLNGTATANSGSNTTVKFCWSQDPTVDANGQLTTSATCASAKTTTLTGNTATSYSDTQTVFTANRLYYYQIQVSNASYSAYGSLFTFTTGAATGTTGAASSISSTGATVSGTANKLSDSGVSAYMCVSTSNVVDVNGQLACDADLQASATTVSGDGVAVSYATTKTLTSGTTYYYQILVNSNNNLGATTGVPAVGAVLSFTTNPVVTFNGNGSTSGSMSSQNAASGTSAALTSNTFSRTRYTFAGWSTSATATSATYTDGASFTFSANTTLYAVWTFNGYIVKFDANGASGTIANQTSNSPAAFSDTTTVTTALTYSGFTFGGWALTPTGSVAYSAGATYAFDADLQLYAVWTTTNRTVHFVGNGASTGTMPAQSIPGGGAALNANQFSRGSAYLFAGWSETSTAVTAQYSDSQTITLTRDITLYALWTSNGHVVTFNPNGGEGRILDQGSLTATTLTLNNGQITKSGFTLVGWTETATSTTVQFADGGNFAFDRDLYLYAIWAGRLTYDGNGSDGGSVPVDSTNYFFGQKATIASPTGFTRAGFYLSGWSLNKVTTAANFNEVVDSGTVDMSTGNVTLYAVWTVKLTYAAPDATGGSVPVDSNYYLPGTSVPVADAPGLLKTDWSFIGWTYNGNDYHIIDADEVILDQNTTVNALWSTTMFKFDVILDDNTDGGSSTTQSGYTSSTVRLIDNPFTRTGYTFGGWSEYDTATVKTYDNRATIVIPNDGYTLTLFAIWTANPTSTTPSTPAPSSGGGGVAPAPTPSATPSASPRPTSSASTAPSAAPKPSATATAKPVIAGTLSTVITAKTIKPNAIVTLKQVVKVAVPTSVTVQSITVNGIATTVQSSSPAPTPSKSPSAGSTPAPSTTKSPTSTQVVAATTTTVVGPDDSVKVNATTDNGQKIQGVVEIEKVDPFTLANVNFDFASAKLTPAAKRILDKVAAVVIDHGFNEIQLAGHTDVFASATFDNQKLSEQRAAAVKAYLAKKLAGEGIAVKTLGLAAKEPVIAKTDEASRALNRRVEILVATK